MISKEAIIYTVIMETAHCMMFKYEVPILGCNDDASTNNFNRYSQLPEANARNLLVLRNAKIHLQR